MPAASDSLLSAVRTSDRAIVRNAVGIGVATGAYGISFGAVSITAGLSVAQTAVLSLLMFTGASQYALVGVLGAGGGALPGVATAVLLGTRNALYGIRLASLLDVRGLRRAGAAQLIIDESTAMASVATSRVRPDSRSGPPASRCSCSGTWVLWPERWAQERSPIPACSGWTQPLRRRSSRCWRRGCDPASRG